MLKSPNTKMVWMVSAGFVLLAGLLLFVLVLPGILKQYRLLPEPESFTELYFEDHQTLPSFLKEAEVATASFTIVNRENRAMKYEYLVTKTATNEARQILSSGSAELANGKQATVPFTFTTATAAAKTRIQVELPTLKQQIHFWINNNYAR